MTVPRKVLFMSAPIGSGHIRAAHAVAAALQRLAPGVTTDFANVFDFFNPRLGRGILKTYLKILDIFPQAYGAAYGWGNNSRMALAGREMVSGYLAGRMSRYIDVCRPDAIVCTHATPAGLAAYLVRKAGLNIPVFAVVTDFVVHRLWVYQEIHRYYVADASLSSFLAEHGIASSRSRVFGIPVDEKFAASPCRDTIRTTLGLQNEPPTILLMGGGAGVLPMTEIIATCENSGSGLQIIAVAGTNASLRDGLLEMQPRLNNCALRVYGFVDNIHELMAASDVIVSKPGGLTSAEALATGLPLIIFKPIPGQEEANTRFLMNRDAAIRVDSLGELQAGLAALTADGAKLDALRQNALELGKAGAAAEIARDILSCLR